MGTRSSRARGMRGGEGAGADGGGAAPAPRAPTVAFSLAVIAHPDNDGGDGDRWVAVHEKQDRGWWLPGGGVDAGQTLAEAAVRESAEEAGADVELSGVLRVEHDGPGSGRLRVIYAARPRGGGAPPPLKSEADRHSRGARWVTLPELRAIGERTLWRSCDDVPRRTCHLRGPEPLEWMTYLAAGGQVSPLGCLQAERLGEPIPWDDEQGDPPRAFYPTAYEAQLLVTDPAGRVLLIDGAPPVVPAAAAGSVHSILSDGDGGGVHAAAAGCAARLGAELSGILRVRHVVDVRAASGAEHTASLHVVYAARASAAAPDAPPHGGRWVAADSAECGGAARELLRLPPQPLSLLDFEGAPAPRGAR